MEAEAVLLSRDQEKNSTTVDYFGKYPIIPVTEYVFVDTFCSTRLQNAYTIYTITVVLSSKNSQRGSGKNPRSQKKLQLMKIIYKFREGRNSSGSYYLFRDNCQYLPRMKIFLNVYCSVLAYQALHDSFVWASLRIISWICMYRMYCIPKSC